MKTLKFRQFSPGADFLEVREKPQLYDLAGDLGFGRLTLTRLKSQEPPILPALPHLGCVRFALCESRGHEWFLLQRSGFGLLRF
jgi:hypothetical protein